MRTNSGIPSLLFGLLLLSAALPAAAVQDVLSLTPVQEHSCIAVELSVDPNQAIAGIRFYNNDALAPFVRLLLMEGEAKMAPDLAQTGLILSEIEGESLSWGEVTLDVPVSTSTGVLHAVFELPAYVERTGEGQGGGTGIGYEIATGDGNAYLTLDGVEWVRVQKDLKLAVELVLAAGKQSGEATSLGQLAQTAGEGWWTRAGQNPEGEAADLQEPASDALAELGPTRRPLTVSPNPFNPRARVSLILSEAGPVSVEVFDVRGRLVRTLQDGVLAAGVHDLVWQGDDDAARPVASGVYWIQLHSGQGPSRERVALVR